MKDNQQIMSVEVSTQNPMALKAISPLEEEDLFTMKNGDDALSESEFVLQLSEDEEEPSKKTSEGERATFKEIPLETEDEILNKFDTSESELPDVITNKLEDKLLDDVDDFETTTQVNGETPETFGDIPVAPHEILETSHETFEISHETPKISHETPEISHETPETSNETEASHETSKTPHETLVISHETPETSHEAAETSHEIPVTSGEASGKTTTISDEAQETTAETPEISTHPEPNVETDPTQVNGFSETSNDLDVADNNADLQNDTVDDMEDKKEEESEDKSTSDNKTKEMEDAVLLKEQIMDTEDLLQIIENKQDHVEADTDNDTETLLEQEDDESDGDKPTDTEMNDDAVDIDDFIAEDDQIINNEAKDIKDLGEGEDVPMGEIGEDVPMGEIDGVDANENSSEDKDEKLLLEEKTVSDEATEVCNLNEKSELGMDVDDSEIKAAEEPLVKTTKRLLSDSESETESKKPKLVEVDEEDISEKPPQEEEEATSTEKINKITALNLFSDYMRSKTLKKLSRADLEEFCLQKMCEAIFHKSEIGELRHQLGVQEQMVEMWRKEVVQLSKQARDLEIVNKRLLHEVRLKNDRDKPLIPVKITRSVGLQVRSDSMLNIVTPKRRPSRPLPTSAVQTIAPKPPIKQVPTTPTKTPPTVGKPASKVLTPKANALLSQALANSAAANAAANKSPIKSPTTPVRVIPVKPAGGKSVIPKVTAVVTPTNSSKPADKNFIDLTDEDDKKPIQTVSASAVPTTSVRIVKTTGNVVTTSSVTNPPRIMYVYNNQLHQGVLATDPSKPGTQKLMLKLNSNMIGQTNGVLATVPGGSLAVNGTTLRPGQPVRLATPVTTVRGALTNTKTVLKHPAPLPPPPLSQLNISARKPIPPRPHLTIRRSSGGIVLSWKMPYNLDNYEAIASYQLYAYQETSAPPNSDMWRKVGDVKALALPMACTLTQFADGNKYHFAVRAVDIHKRMGQFSEPEQILL